MGATRGEMMRVLALGVAAVALAGCATVPGETSRNDPYEEFNRKMLSFNFAVDEAILEPASEAYVAVTPKYGRDRVSDFFGNLREPVTFVNEVLQGEGERALQTTARFSINSTLGLAGLFDITGFEGIDRPTEDFGQTLAVWGVDSGPYLVLPFLGPSNPRDFIGGGVDRALDPTNYARYSGNDDDELSYRSGLAVLAGLNARAALQEQFDQLGEQPEPYVALRRIYTSSRDAEIRNGQEDPNAYQDLPDFDDF